MWCRFPNGKWARPFMADKNSKVEMNEETAVPFQDPAVSSLSLRD
jgi:hypothetical protein